MSLCTLVGVARAARSLYLSQVTAARSQLEERVWEAAWSEGWAMTPEEAIESTPSQKRNRPRQQRKLSASPTVNWILRLVAEGLTVSEVAQRLYLSPCTVGQHLRSIYRKLGVLTRAAAAKEAV